MVGGFVCCCVVLHVEGVAFWRDVIVASRCLSKQWRVL